MVIELLKTSLLAMGAFTPLLFSTKRAIKIRMPKNHNDTSGAQYAINDHGYLERIHHDDLSNYEQ